jgi:septum formation inhibitor-activating ATPase MinD
MSMAKAVVIVAGADKGGVGKTAVSRTLLDYFYLASPRIVEAIMDDHLYFTV